MLKLSIILAWFTVLLYGHECISQENYIKNEYVETKCTLEGSNYRFSLKFKDHNGEDRKIAIKFNKKQTDVLESKFGIPASSLTSDGRIRMPKDEVIANGFRYNGDFIGVDYHRLIGNYSDLICKPFAKTIVKFLRSKGLDNRENRINLTMALVQDIPYGIPKESTSGKYRGECMSPAELLINGYGDCDSKGVLFAGIMSYLIPKDHIYLVTLGKEVNHVRSGHFVTAIKSKNVEGKSFYVHKGEKMVVVETAGPGKKKFGKRSRLMPFLESFEQL